MSGPREKVRGTGESRRAASNKGTEYKDLWARRRRAKPGVGPNSGSRECAVSVAEELGRDSRTLNAAGPTRQGPKSKNGALRRRSTGTRKDSRTLKAGGPTRQDPKSRNGAGCAGPPPRRKSRGCHESTHLPLSGTAPGGETVSRIQKSRRAGKPGKPATGRGPAPQVHFVSPDLQRKLFGGSRKFWAQEREQEGSDQGDETTVTRGWPGCIRWSSEKYWCNKIGNR